MVIQIINSSSAVVNSITYILVGKSFQIKDVVFSFYPDNRYPEKGGNQ